MENQMKKIQLAMLSASIIGMTATAVNAQSKFEGFYGQVGVGFSSVTPSLKGVTITPPAGNSPSSYGMGSSIDSTNSFAGAIGLGYTFAVAPKFTIGIGADYLPFNGQSGNFTITNSSLSPSSQTSTFKQKETMNLYIAPGLEITPESMLYAKLGYSASSFSYGNGGSQNLNGYLVGLGYKQIIQGGFYGFAEANYTSYGEANVSGSGAWNSGVTGTYATNGKLSANTFTGLVGVGYKF
jgi:outer membrane immunogenic protein